MHLTVIIIIIVVVVILDTNGSKRGIRLLQRLQTTYFFALLCFVNAERAGPAHDPPSTITVGRTLELHEWMA